VNLVPTGVYALAKNIEAVNSAGWESDLQFRDSIGKKTRIMAQAGVLWISNTAKTNRAGFYLNSHARLLINGLVDVSFGRFGVSTGYIYKERASQRTSTINASLSPSYFLLNARIQFLVGTRGNAVYLQADNLSNRKYSDLLGAPMPGRWLSMGIRVGR